MRRLADQLYRGVVAPLWLLLGLGSAQAADLAPPPPAAAPLPVPTAWTYRFTPYGWLTALNGRQTIRGRSFKVNATFVDIVEKSDTLVALMGDFEAKNGPVTLYADLVWSNIGADRSNVKTRGLFPGISVTTARSLDLDIDMAIAEAGAFYEIGRYGPVAFELLAGARYWYQEASLSFDAVRSVEIADLEFNGARAFAKSGSVDWLDPLVGARVRWEVAPGQSLFLRGDIGGFSVGSRFSWQAVGGYLFNLGTWQGIEFAGVIGYRALSVDYTQGQGNRRYEFDMVQHGPLFGLSLRF